MWFKNLLLYRLTGGWNISPGALEKKLAAKPLLPCAGLSMKSRGWVPPRGEGALVCSQERHLLIAMGAEEKMLPSSVIAQTVKQRAAEIEKVKGHKPGRKQLRDLKDQVTTELLPRAFARRRTVRAWLDPASGWIAIDSSSPARGEDLLTLLRETLDESPWALCDAERAPSDVMTKWLAAGRAANGFALGDECELTGEKAEKPTVKYVRHGLEGDDVRQHLTLGKRVTRLKLHWHDRLAFVLDEKLQVKRVAMLGMKEAREEAQVQDPDEQFDTEFALMTGELGKLIADLGKTLGLKARS